MRALLATTSCDLCGYGGMYSEPADFVSNGGYDFCRWCSNQPLVGRLESGGHAVTLPGDGSWLCSCGQTHQAVVATLRAHGLSSTVIEAVPGGFASATASLHVNTPNWPKTTL